MPPGLNTIDDGVSLLAAVAPPRPVTRASCSLMLNAFAEAMAEEPSVAAKRILEMWFVFMVTSYLFDCSHARASTCMRTVPPMPSVGGFVAAGRMSDECTYVAVVSSVYLMYLFSSAAAVPAPIDAVGAGAARLIMSAFAS